MRRRVSLGTMVFAVVAATLLAGPAGYATAQSDDKPKPPKSVEVESYVIMASKGKLSHVDPALKELVELLKKYFKERFNRFRLENKVGDKVKLDEPMDLALLLNYFLKIKYTGVSRIDEQEMVDLVWRLIRKEVEEDKEGKKKVVEITVAGPFSVSVVRGSFFLFGGPEIKGETMILAIRVKD